MSYNYNLQESVSEECFNDIMTLVQEYVDEDLHPFAAYLDGVGRKHAPGLIKAAGDGVKNTANNIKHSAGEFLATSNSKVANTLKKVPGVRKFARSHAASQLRQARSSANAEHNNTVQKELAKHTQNLQIANASPNPAQAVAQANKKLITNIDTSKQNRANKMAALKAKYRNV